MTTAFRHVLSKAKPMHEQHPAFVEFMDQGTDSVPSRAPKTSFQASIQPHAMATYDLPLKAYVAWRPHLDTLPQLCARKNLT